MEPKKQVIKLESDIDQLWSRVKDELREEINTLAEHGIATASDVQLAELCVKLVASQLNINHSNFLLDKLDELEEELDVA